MTAPSSTPTFGTQVIGQTEKALNAILDRQLAGTGLTEPQWVTLTVTVVSRGNVDRDQLVGRVAGALKVSQVAAQERIAELAAAQLLETGEGDSVKVTEAGQARWSEIRAAITQITQGLWGDLPAEDLATAGRVLNTVLERANALLATA
jgi:DNA-binding MarR family transcriptional regulator